MRTKTHRLRHTGTVPLTTERLLLRRIALSDCEAVHTALATDQSVIEGIDWDPHPTPESTRRGIEQMIERYDDEEHPDYNWLIVEKETGDLVGLLFLDEYTDARRTGEVDYCIARAHRGKGYAPEALRHAIDHLFDEVGFYRIEAVYNLSNDASGRVMEKVGMQFEGVLRGRALRLGADGYPEGLNLRAILATDRRG